MAERLVPVQLRAVPDAWDDVAARVRNPDRRRRLVEFNGPFGTAALSLSVPRRNAAVHGNGVATLTLDAPRMAWPPTPGELAAGVWGHVDGSPVLIRSRLRSWRPSRRFVAVEVDGAVTHLLRKTPWDDELALTATQSGMKVGSTVPVAVAADASRLDVAVVLVLSTLDLLDTMTFARGVLRYL